MSSKSRDFTMSHYVDVLKGSKNQKVLAAGHDQLQQHGRLNELKNNDIERLLRKMMSEGLIREEVKVLEFGNSGFENIVAYIRLGDRAKAFYTGTGASFQFPVVQKAKKTKLKQTKLPVHEENEVSRQVYEMAYEALEEVSRQIAAGRGMHHHNVLPLDVLREMSKKLPTSEAEMLKIPHVTKQFFDKFGQRYLKVTKEYKNMLEDQRRMQNEDGLFDDLDEEKNEPIDFDAVQRIQQADRPSTSGVRGGRTAGVSRGGGRGGGRGGKKTNNGFKRPGGIKKKNPFAKKSPYFGNKKTSAKKGKFGFWRDRW